MVREIVRAERAALERRADQRARMRGYPPPARRPRRQAHPRQGAPAVVRRMHERYCERPQARSPRALRSAACSILALAR
jgi:hypothetical protein